MDPDTKNSAPKAQNGVPQAPNTAPKAGQYTPKSMIGDHRGRPGFSQRKLVKVYLEQDDFDALSVIVRRKKQKISEFIRDLIQKVVRKRK